MRHGVHWRTREVAANLLLLAKGEANPRLGNVNHIVVPAHLASTKVAGLALDLHLSALETVGCTNLVNVLGSTRDDTNAVGIAEGRVNGLGRHVCRKSIDGVDDAICNVLGLNLTGKDLALEFCVCVLHEGSEVVKVLSCTRREKRFHLPL